MTSAIAEVLALAITGTSDEIVTFTPPVDPTAVRIVCTRPETAATWHQHTPNGVLPESGVPVVVELVPALEEVGR